MGDARGRHHHRDRADHRRARQSGMANSGRSSCVPECVDSASARSVSAHGGLMNAQETRGAYRSVVATGASRSLFIGGVILLAAMIALPAVVSRGVIQDLIFVLYMLALAQCWNLLAGYAGLVSV